MIPKQRKKLLDALKKEMAEWAERLEYEEAAILRDKIQEIQNQYGK
jgi:excinuclease ABC subunit B